MKDNLVRTNIVLTRDMKDALQKEANTKYGGNVSYLLRMLLGKRYKLEWELK